jgi:hypothetical protein
VEDDIYAQKERWFRRIWECFPARENINTGRRIFNRIVKSQRDFDCMYAALEGDLAAMTAEQAEALRHDPTVPNHCLRLYARDPVWSDR